MCTRTVIAPVLLERGRIFQCEQAAQPGCRVTAHFWFRQFQQPGAQSLARSSSPQLWVLVLMNDSFFGSVGVCFVLCSSQNESLSLSGASLHRCVCTTREQDLLLVPLTVFQKWKNCLHISHVWFLRVNLRHKGINCCNTCNDTWIQLSHFNEQMGRSSCGPDIVVSVFFRSLLLSVWKCCLHGTFANSV